MVLLPDLVTSDVDSWLRARLDFRQSASKRQREGRGVHQRHRAPWRCAVLQTAVSLQGPGVDLRGLSEASGPVHLGTGPHRMSCFFFLWIYVDSLKPQDQSTTVLDVTG